MQSGRTHAEAAASAIDVAEYILEKLGELDTRKLQKLVYYCQARAAADYGRRLFRERIEAWRGGPVVPDLYQMHAGQHKAHIVGGHSERLSGGDRQLIDEVLLYYGSATANRLVEATHDEAPWQDARGNLPETAPSGTEIQIDALASFYRNRPWGVGRPVHQHAVDTLSPERVARARAEISRGDFLTIPQIEDELRR